MIASGPLDAPPVVMLPCWQGTATVWRPNVEVTESPLAESTQWM